MVDMSNARASPVAHTGRYAADLVLGSACLAFFATWTLASQVAFITGLSFATGWWIAWPVASAAGIVAGWRLGREFEACPPLAAERRLLLLAVAAATFDTARTMVLGSQLRGYAAVFASLILPFALADAPHRRTLAAYSIACSALLLLPWTSSLFGRFSYATIAWRWLFVIPFVLALVIVADRLIACFPTTATRAAALLTIAFALVVPPSGWVVSTFNHAAFDWPGYRTPEQGRVNLRPYGTEARIDRAWLISPVTGKRH